MTPKEYMESIDLRYNQAKKDGITRFDLSWGAWSGEMNRETRKTINDDPDSKNSILLKYVFNYWVVTSQLLELHYKKRHHKLFTNKKIKRLSKERKAIREIVLTGNISKRSIDELDKLFWNPLMKIQ